MDLGLILCPPVPALIICFMIQSFLDQGTCFAFNSILLRAGCSQSLLVHWSFANHRQDFLIWTTSAAYLCTGIFKDHIIPDFSLTCLQILFCPSWIALMWTPLWKLLLATSRIHPKYATGFISSVSGPSKVVALIQKYDCLCLFSFSLINRIWPTM